jgi:hypothetical protein
MRPRAKAETAGAVTRLAAIALTSILTVCGPGVAQQSVTPKPATPQRAAAKSAPPAKPSAAESTKCIGVVSAIGDTFHLRKIGITVFNNDSNTVPIESWQIDNLVISKISTFLSKSWTVRRVNYPKGAFSSLDEKHPLFYNYDDDLQGIVRGLSSSTRCDHYAVVVKGGSQFSDTNQSLYGLGVLEIGAPLRTGDFIYALYSIRLYDGQTFAVLGRRDAVIEQPNLLNVFFKPIHGPYLGVDTSWWPEADADIRSLVEKSLDVTMPLILRVD